MSALLIISVFGLSAGALSFKGIKGSEAPIIGLCLSIIFIYLFAIFGLLNIAVYSIVLIGLIMIPLVVVFNKSDLKSFVHRISEPGFVIFTVLLLALYPICRPIVTGAWDEYSHWALVVRNMLLIGGMPEAGGAVLYIAYPPASTLFQYLFMKVSNGPEGMMYYAQAVLMAATLASLLKGQRFKKPALLIISIMVVVLAMIKFSVHNIFNIFPDTIMAVLASAIFVMYYKSERDTSGVIKLLPIFFVLTIVRANAIVFALFAAILIFIASYSKNERDIKKSYLKAVLPLAVIILSYVSWQIYIKAIAADGVGTGNPIFPIDFHRLWTMLDNFKSAIFFQKLGTVYQPLNLASTTFAFLTMAILISVIINILLKNNKEQQKMALKLNISLFVCFGIYCLSLFYTYQYVFTEANGTKVSSFHRYMGTMFVFWVITVYFILTNLLENEHIFSRGQKRIVFALGISIIISLTVLTHPSMLNIISGRRLVNVYEEEAIQCAKEIQDVAGTQAKIYMIFQKSRGYVFMGTRYQLGTNPANLGTWSLGEPYSEDDTWTVDISPQDFLKRLYELDYEYVYVASGGDAQLWEGYGELFDMPDSGYKMFRVTDDDIAPLKAVK